MAKDTKVEKAYKSLKIEKAYECLKGKIKPSQQVHYRTIRWLIDDVYRREGRTTMLAIMFLEQAIINPARSIRVFDHYGQDFRTMRHLTNKITELATAIGVSIATKINVNNGDAQISFRGFLRKQTKKKKGGA